MNDRMAWVNQLSPTNQRIFMEEVVEELQQLSDFLDSWRSTAELDAKPEILAEILRPKTYRPLSVTDAPGARFAPDS